jgi:hypothetical protein
MSTEIRTTSATGGEKGVKPERLSLLPRLGLAAISRVYGFGADKYAAHNWRRGYEWDKSHDALLRHVLAHIDGETYDEESGLPHLAHAGFHILAVLTWLEEQGEGADNPMDTRWPAGMERASREQLSAEAEETLLLAEQKRLDQARITAELQDALDAGDIEPLDDDEIDHPWHHHQHGKSHWWWPEEYAVGKPGPLPEGWTDLGYVASDGTEDGPLAHYELRGDDSTFANFPRTDLTPFTKMVDDMITRMLVDQKDVEARMAGFAKMPANDDGTVTFKVIPPPERPEGGWLSNLEWKDPTPKSTESTRDALTKLSAFSDEAMTITMQDVNPQTMRLMLGLPPEPARFIAGVEGVEDLEPPATAARASRWVTDYDDEFPRDRMWTIPDEPRFGIFEIQNGYNQIWADLNAVDLDIRIADAWEPYFGPADDESPIFAAVRKDLSAK